MILGIFVCVGIKFGCHKAWVTLRMKHLAELETSIA